MKRLASVILAIVVTVMLIGGVRNQGGEARSVSPSIIGSWSLTSRTEGTVRNTLYAFFADGTAISTDPENITWIGVWTLVGKDDVAFTFNAINPDDGSMMGQHDQFALGDDRDKITIGTSEYNRILPNAKSEAFADPST